MRCLAAAALALSLAAGAAADAPAPPRRSGVDARLGNWVRFHASFDQGVQADLAEGAVAPLRVRGRIRLEPGRAGRAVVLGVAGGGAEIVYAAPGNLDLTRPGGLSAWVAARSWEDADAPVRSRYVRLFRMAGQPPTLFVLERDYRVRGADRESFLAGVFELPGRGSFYAAVDGGPKWRAGEWHLFALAWDATGFSVSRDGGPLVRTSVPGEVLPRLFSPSRNSEFAIGDGGEESWLLDELTIYSRALTAEDVAALRGAPGPD